MSDPTNPIVPGKTKVDSIVIKPTDIEVFIPPANRVERKRFFRLRELANKVLKLKYKIEEKEKETEVKVLEEALGATEAKGRQKLAEARTHRAVEEYKADHFESHEQNVRNSLQQARKKNQFLGGL